jgi:hypothetical protein
MPLVHSSFDIICDPKFNIYVPCHHWSQCSRLDRFMTGHKSGEPRVGETAKPRAASYRLIFRNPPIRTRSVSGRDRRHLWRAICTELNVNATRLLSNPVSQFQNKSTNHTHTNSTETVERESVEKYNLVVSISSCN